MSQLRPAAPVDALDLMAQERGVLVNLLRHLSSQDWDRPTECPAWSVKGIALHLLGDDLSLLSRQRDAEPSGVTPMAEGEGWEGLLGGLDRFNEQWVEVSSFLGRAALVELLEITGEWTHRWYAGVDPERRGEPVHWVGPDPAPYWLLAAREYLERWIHHQQIRRAVDEPPLDDERWVATAVAVTARGFPQALGLLNAASGATITIHLSGSGHAWTFTNDGPGWSMADGAPAGPTVRLELSVSDAAVLFSRGLSRAEAGAVLRVAGDPELSGAFAAGVAAFFGR